MKNSILSNVSFCVLSVLCVLAAGDENQWPQASGPNANWQVNGSAPTQWSVVRNENIAWKTELPEGGQSSVTVFGDRAFLTTHAPLGSSDEITTSTDILGFCLDANTGKRLWNVRLPGSVAVGTAGIFSDATVFAPVTDGKYVWFFNRSGSIGCYEFNGKRRWLREYTPRNRHTNRECEPILLGDQIITVEVLNKENGALLKRHAPVPDDINEKSVWTYLHGINKNTGEVLWTESVGTVCHNTPMIGRTHNGDPAIIHARGGGHGPLEKPYGISLTDLAPGREGRTLWSIDLGKFDPSCNSHWNSKYVFAFQGEDHVLLDSQTGEEVSRRNVNKNVSYWKRDLDSKRWSLIENTDLKVGRKHPHTNQTNIVVGEWHYFLAHDVNAIGRVHIDGRVEYLEVPIQLAASENGKNTWIWDKNDVVPIDTVNSRGINIAGDKRATRSGWGHVSAASPTLVGRHLLLPLMTGTVFVIDAEAPHLNGDALVAINDLGPAGKTWTLSSFAYANNALFMRTMKNVMRIEIAD